MDEARVREVLHKCFAEVIEYLFLPGVHNITQVQAMSHRVHIAIDTLTDSE